MKCWLGHASLLAMILGLSTGSFWSRTPKDEIFAMGKKFVGLACRNSDSDKCKGYMATFWSPKSAIIDLAKTDPIVPPITPIPEDPCHRGDCFNWIGYRRQVIYPLIRQLQKTQAIERFTDDREEGSMFSSYNFKEWHDVQSLPPDDQTISTQTAAVLSLKLFAACLAQGRMVRVEELYRSGITWQAAISTPGSLLLAVYLAARIYQLKRLCLGKCERREDRKQEKFINKLLISNAHTAP